MYVTNHEPPSLKKYTYIVERFGDTCRNLCYVNLNFLFHIVLVFRVLYFTSTFEAKLKRTKKGVPLDLLVSDNFTPILIDLDCLNYGDKRCQLQIKEAPMTKVRQNAEIFQTDFGYHHRCQPYMLPLLQDPV